MTKKCPFCAEEIQADAIKCRHCRSHLEVKNEPKKIEPLPREAPRSPSKGFLRIVRALWAAFETFLPKNQPARFLSLALGVLVGGFVLWLALSLPNRLHTQAVPIVRKADIPESVVNVQSTEGSSIDTENSGADFSQIRIELEGYNASMSFDDMPVLFNRSIYVPGFGIVNYVRFNDNCRGECGVNFVPFQGMISSLSFLTVLKDVPSLPGDEFIMNYFDHDTWVGTSTIRKNDLQKNADAIDQKKGLSSYVDSEKVSYSKSEYPIYGFLEGQRDGFTRHNGFGDKMREVIA